MNKLLRSTAIALAFLVLIQVIPVKRSNPPGIGEIQAPAEVKPIFRRACYDCHSYATKWPWYSRVAPVSWMVADHVNEGRSKLNFSLWSDYSAEQMLRKQGEIVEQIESGEMPLASYLLIHRDAGLSEAEKKILITWARKKS